MKDIVAGELHTVALKNDDTVVATGKNNYSQCDVTNMSEKITWTASNNSSFLNGERSAKTILGAVRAARRYLRYELYGEGTLTIRVDGVIVRVDERSIHTGYSWETIYRG